MTDTAQTTGTGSGAGAAAPALLGAGEPAPVGTINAAGDPRLLVVCDHAGQRMPLALGDLGIAAHRYDEHIAWDAGALAVARGLAEQLDAPLIFGRYSRLAVDLNRAPADVSAVPAISDGILIPGNLGLSAAQRAARISALHAPYHATIAAHLAAARRLGLAPIVIAVHSFTPRVSRVFRPWEAGVLWDKDPRIAVPLLAGLRAAQVCVGDNEPYSGRHTADYTIDTHAEGNGLAHAAIELRQDRIANAGTQHIWAELLASILRPILQDERLYAYNDGGTEQ